MPSRFLKINRTPIPFFFTDWYFAAVDNIMLAIYTVEVVVRMYVWRKDYFKEGWYMLGMSSLGKFSFEVLRYLNIAGKPQFSICFAFSFYSTN